MSTVDMVSIGEFSRLSRLSPKALRLYDELGLLVPARVDAETGYRWYADTQLDQARLVSAAPGRTANSLCRCAEPARPVDPEPAAVPRTVSVPPGVRRDGHRGASAPRGQWPAGADASTTKTGISRSVFFW